MDKEAQLIWEAYTNSLEETHAGPPYNTLTLDQLIDIWSPFINKMVTNYGNKREDVINYHIKKMANIPINQALAKAPRGPANRGNVWADLIFNCRHDMKLLAYKQNQSILSGDLHSQYEES